MASAEARRRERRARWAYERGRLLRAALGFAPALLLIACAGFVGGRPLLAAAFGSALYPFGLIALWRGEEAGRAVLPGVLAGAVPLVLSLCTSHIGHFCAAGSCYSLCLGACVVGGVTGGFIVARLGSKERHSVSFWLVGSGLALLTGALGCGCVGYSGLAWLAAGYALGLVPSGAHLLMRALGKAA